MVCPGKSWGLDKNLALLAHATTEQNKKYIIYLCINLGVEDINSNPLIDY